MNQRLGQRRKDGHSAIRTFHRAKKGKKDARFLFKCGCCDQKVEVYYGGDSLEINGVLGSVKNWRELLLPVLNMKLSGQGKEEREPATRSRTRRRPAR